MFPFFKKKAAAPSTLNLLGTDMHSHLIPGIDDGSPEMEVSVALIKGLQQLGYKKIITTPHIMWDMYKNEREGILAKEKIVKEELKNQGIDMEFKAAAEYYMDDYFAALLNNKSPLLTLKDKWVLVEFSFVAAPLDLQHNLFQLEIQGYKPVLAHPERYAYFHIDKKQYHDFFDQGCLLQLNLLSLTGYYGKVVLETAKYLLKNRLVSLFGTDMHHSRHLDALNNKDLFRLVAEAVETGDILNSQL